MLPSTRHMLPAAETAEYEARLERCQRLVEEEAEIKAEIEWHNEMRDKKLKERGWKVPDFKKPRMGPAISKEVADARIKEIVDRQLKEQAERNGNIL
jgi:anti-sigma factor RsiW